MTPAERSLEHRVCAALKKSPYLSRRRLHCEADQDRVVLRGVVDSYYQKQMAQEILRRIEGVGHIENHLEVNWTKRVATAEEIRS